MNGIRSIRPSALEALGKLRSSRGQLGLTRGQINDRMAFREKAPQVVEFHYAAGRHRLLLPGLKPSVPQEAASRRATIEPIGDTWVLVRYHAPETPVRVDIRMRRPEACLSILLIWGLPPGIHELEAPVRAVWKLALDVQNFISRKVPAAAPVVDRGTLGRLPILHAGRHGIRRGHQVRHVLRPN